MFIDIFLNSFLLQSKELHGFFAPSKVIGNFVYLCCHVIDLQGFGNIPHPSLHINIMASCGLSKFCIFILKAWT